MYMLDGRQDVKTNVLQTYIFGGRHCIPKYRFCEKHTFSEVALVSTNHEGVQICLREQPTCLKVARVANMFGGRHVVPNPLC